MKKNKTISLFLMLIVAAHLFAQQHSAPIWSYRYDLDSLDEYGRAIVPLNSVLRGSGYIAISAIDDHSADPQQHTHYIGLNFIDEEGILIDQTTILPPAGFPFISCSWNFAVEEMGVNGYALICVTRDTSDKYHSVLKKLDRHGDPLWDTMLSEPDKDVLCYNVRRMTNTDLMVSGQQWQPGVANSTEALLVRFDAGGNELWRNTASIGSGYGSFVELSNGDLFVVHSVTISNGTQRIALARLTATGTQIWDLVFPQFGADDGINRILELDNGNFALAGSTDMDPHHVYTDIRPLMVIIDEQGTVINSSIDSVPGMDSYFHYDAVLHPNGNIATTGVFLRYDPNMLVNDFGHVTMYDQNGNLLWMKLYAYTDSVYDDTYNYLSGITVGNDGQLVCSGTSNPAGSSGMHNDFKDLWVVKVDTTGPPAFFTTVQERELFKNVEVYPNPANEWLNVRSLHDVIEKVLLLDMAGRVIEEKDYAFGANVIALNVSERAPGQYLVKVFNARGTRIIPFVIE